MGFIQYQFVNNISQATLKPIRIKSASNHNIDFLFNL